MELISCRGLRLERGGVVLLEDTDLVIEAGERILITGPSGCGKSTLLRHLCMLEPGAEQTIFLQGRALAEWVPGELRRAVAYLPQTPVTVEGSVRDNLCLPYTLKVYSGTRPDDKALKAALESLNLEIALDADAEQLSPGQKARLALVQRLLLKPQVLLCDEPIAALDQDSAALVVRALEQAGRDGMTQVLVSHQPLHGASGRCFRFVDRRLELSPS